MQPDEQQIPVGRSLEELTIPRSPLMPPVEVFDGELQRIEASLRPSVPEEIRKRITTTRNLAVYGAFSYDFFAVSVYWSLTCIEMAVWSKYKEKNPGPTKRMTLKPLLQWASTEGLWPSQVVAANSILHLRNSFAHPKEFSSVLTPGMALDFFKTTVDIVNYLWPLDVS
jgi:hypothetical protein